MPDKNAPPTAPEESQVAVTPDEEVAERAQELDDIRAKIQEVRDERSRKEANLSHELRMADLDVEKARLLVELDNEKRINEKLDTSSDSSFENADAAMRLAVAQMEGSQALKKAEDEAAEKSAAEETPPTNAVLTDTPVPDGAAPPVAAKPEPAKTASPTTAKAAK